VIGVINYGAGNLGSVMNALARLGLPARFVQGPEELVGRGSGRPRGVAGEGATGEGATGEGATGKGATGEGSASEGTAGAAGSSGSSGARSSGPAYSGIIFPGDGQFATAMEALDRSGYSEAIREWITADRPFLGICIGLQLLFETSEEAPPVQGREIRGLSVIPGTVRKFQGPKVPQIGWNETRGKGGAKLFSSLPDRSFFYYIHSYYVVPDAPDWVAAEADYYGTYCSAVERGALTAVQFHPEKSGALGLELLRRWAEVYHVS